MAIVMAVVLAYPTLLGPCCWVSSRTGRGASLVSAVFQPLKRFGYVGTEEEYGGIEKVLDFWSELGAKDDWHWVGTYAGDGDSGESPDDWSWNEFQFPSTSAPF